MKAMVLKAPRTVEEKPLEPVGSGGTGAGPRHRRCDLLDAGAESGDGPGM